MACGDYPIGTVPAQFYFSSDPATVAQWLTAVYFSPDDAQGTTGGSYSIGSSLGSVSFNFSFPTANDKIYLINPPLPIVFDGTFFENISNAHVSTNLCRTTDPTQTAIPVRNFAPYTIGGPPDLITTVGTAVTAGLCTYLKTCSQTGADFHYVGAALDATYAITIDGVAFNSTTPARLFTLNSPAVINSITSNNGSDTSIVMQLPDPVRTAPLIWPGTPIKVALPPPSFDCKC